MIPRVLLASGRPASLGRDRRFYVYPAQTARHGVYVGRREVIGDVEVIADNGSNNDIEACMAFL